jgi:hypothetical protein
VIHLRILSHWQNGRVKRRPNLAVELLVVAALLVVFDFVAGLANLRAGAAYAHGRDMLRLTPFHLELRADHWFAHVGWLHAPAAYYYDLGHINVTMVALLVGWWWRPAVYRRARNALVIVNLIGLAVFYLYPVAPPRLLPGGGFVDIVGLSGTWGASDTSPTHANAFGSMPSLHAAWALWVALAVMTMTTRWRWRALGWAHVAITCVVVIITGNHYVVDLLAGFLTVAVAWAISGRLAVQPAPPIATRDSQPVPR